MSYASQLNVTVATHVFAAGLRERIREVRQEHDLFPLPILSAFQAPDETRSFDAGKRATVSEDPYRWLVETGPSAIGDGSHEFVTVVRSLATYPQYATLLALKDCLPHAVIYSSWNNLSHGPDS